MPSNNTIKRQLVKIKALEVAAKQKTAITSTEGLKEIAIGQQMKSKLSRVLGGDKPSYTHPDTSSKVDDFIKEAFGADGSEVENTLTKDMANLKPPKITTGTNTERSLQDVIDNSELAAATTYYTVTGYIAEQDQKKKNREKLPYPAKTEKASEPPKSADECKKTYNRETLQE
uniref:Variant surface glycoprotein n=1 Tax=Trypanosoma brucei TaxID=5691 RepID=A0A1V0FYQ1_9TRYP|nr:variant surface glycoprotein [Trypanosoma brucei]